MMVQTINRLSANNAAYNWMSSADALRSLAFTGGGNSKAIQEYEKRLQAQMLNDSLNYKANLLIEESMDRVRKENIKRSFSIFA